MGLLSAIADNDATRVRELIELVRHSVAVGGGRAPAAAAAVAKYINERFDHENRGALHVACIGHGTEIVQILVEHGANVNAHCPAGKTALTYAIEYQDNKEMVAILVKAGADINLKDEPYGWTPLHLACRLRSVDMVLFLIQSCGANVEAMDHYRRTPLHHAVETNNGELASSLIKMAGANMEAVDGRERTPLRLSIDFSNTTAFFYLMECGANVDATDMAGETIFHSASQRGPGLLKWLLEQCGSVERVNVPDIGGMTPLHYAAIGSCAATVQLLVYAGADVKAIDAAGRTPVHIAATNGGRQVLVFLNLLHTDWGIN